MTVKVIIVWLVSWMVIPADDLLRFINGDQLHGRFHGMALGPKIIWQRDDLTTNGEFDFSQVRHLIFNNGKSYKNLASLSYISCTNGDRLPGIVTALDAESVTLQTPFAGELKLARTHVAMLAPSPLGGRISYHGPFIENEWTMAHASFPGGLPPRLPSPQNGRNPDVELPKYWQFSGAAWIWPHKSSGTALIRRSGMPDRCTFRFDLAWKNRLSIAVAFQADFAPTQPPKDKEPIRFVPGDSSVLPLIFGNGYVMHFFSNHVMLYRTSVNGAGIASLERVQANANILRLGDSGKATVEIRSNRITGRVSLFLNDEFAAQWSEIPATESITSQAGHHRGFGFVVQAENTSVRLSDMMVAEWNGMPDSARSLQVDEQDIVLLANGTDRFSGKVKSLAGGKVQLVGRFSEFSFPLDEVAEIRFAKNRLAPAAEQAAGEAIIRFSPLGHITGKILSADQAVVKLQHPLLGEISCELQSAVMLDFQPSNNPIDDWNSEF